MTLKQYLIIMFLATLMCFGASGIVLFNIDPQKDNAIGFLFFYTTLFFGLVGTISLMNFGLYYMVTKSNYPLFRLVERSFRNGVIGATLVLSMLFLQALNILNLWTGLILFILVLSISFFKLSTRAHEKNTL